ncbi:MAG: serine/threonine protein kinase, partial [Deltaproteobacteria bacterium]|nr:serine/threonine protein kinase [Deltaproteobacteria bacterium]
AKALPLISARELDAAELKRLETLVAAGTDAESLRLRAELAMRRADGKATWAIESYLTLAPADVRAQRYQGWLLASKGLPGEAAVLLGRSGSRREQARLLLRVNDLVGAAALLDGAPDTAEELVTLALIAIRDGKLDVAQGHLAQAEQLAPVSPFVQAAIAKLAARQARPELARIARLLIGQTAPDGAAGSATVIVDGSGSLSGRRPPSKVVVDLGTAVADSRVVEPMLEALQLAELAKRKLVVAELAWSPGALSMRSINPEVLRAALMQALGTPPYELQVVLLPTPLEGETVPLDKLAALASGGDGALIYRVESAGSDARITLLLYETGAKQATQVTRVVTMPGLVTFNVVKLVTILVVVLVLVLVGVLRATRSMGKIELQIARSADHDEALCVELSNQPTRPKIADMLAFHTATKSAGSVVRRRSATLIASGATFQVPTGAWYVHLYGTYAHGGKLRLVPETCTQQVEVKRGATVEVAFDLVAKATEVTVQVIVEPRRGVLVWTDAAPSRVATNDAGEAELMLPLGTHVIHIDAHGVLLSSELQVGSSKPHRLTINVARELRLGKDIELDADAARHNDLELVLSAGPRTPLPFKAATHPDAGDAVPAGLAKTQAVSSGRAVPGELLLDRYRVTSELGRGAMGIVHRAWDEKLEREVAIKEMADDLRKVPEALQLFTQEAKALAQLNHTNIVAMYDQVTEVDKIFMIMEYVDGKPLEAVIAERGALPWLEAVAIIDQVCSGLAYAHARKVIHRDIKPANIFVATDNTVKIGDFGLARVMREVTIRRTEIRGTPLYMPPEQITGTDVDHRSDLYAIGCTLFELLCGRPPFIDGDILYAQMNTAPPRASSLMPGLPPELDAILLSLLAKHPDDRPGSANDVRAKLRELSI